MMATKNQPKRPAAKKAAKPKASSAAPKSAARRPAVPPAVEERYRRATQIAKEHGVVGRLTVGQVLELYEGDAEGRILVFREKHGSRYFDAQTPEKAFAACLKILRERWGGEDAWMDARSELAQLEAAGPAALDFDEAGIAAMPESLRKEATEKLEQHKRQTRRHEQEVQEMRAIVGALDQKDGATAFRICMQRRDAEYEWVEFQYLEDTDD